MIRVEHLEHFARDPLACLEAHTLAALIVKPIEATHLVRRPAAGGVKVVELEEGPGVKVVDVVLL
jgi:hypothetical protein